MKIKFEMNRKDYNGEHEISPKGKNLARSIARCAFDIIYQKIVSMTCEVRYNIETNLGKIYVGGIQQIGTFTVMEGLKRE